MSKRILIDMDGVAIDFVTSVVAIVNRIKGTSYTPADVTEWDISKCLDMTPDEKAQLDAAVKRPGFCLSLPIYAGMRAVIDKLRDIADVYAVTAPYNSDYWMRERETSMVENLGFTRKTVIFSDCKYVCSGDILIDDKTSALVDWMKHNLRGRTVLFNQSWNRNDVAPDARADQYNLLPTVRNLLERW